MKCETKDVKSEVENDHLLAYKNWNLFVIILFKEREEETQDF